MEKWFVIINPVSGNNFVKKKKSLILDSLQKLKLEYEIAYTEYSKHEEVLVKLAVNKGFNKFISIGGDGTLHHVVNGVMNQKVVSSSEVTIGVIPVGTGNDWIKNNSIPKSIGKSIEILNNNYTSKLDIGKLKFENKEIYFNNLAGVGFDGYVVNKTNKLKFLGKLSYPIASVIGFFGFKKCNLKFTFNDKTINHKSLMLIIGLDKYCGGGMRLTSNPDPKDGLFDLTIVKEISTLGLLINIAKMYNGKLIEHKKVETYKSERVKVEVLGKEIPFIQTDGEIIGKGSFEVEILPLAISFVVGK